MNKHPSEQNDRIEELVRLHLEERESWEDAPSLLEGVRRRMESAPVQPSSLFSLQPSKFRLFAKWGVGFSAIAAGILFFLFGFPGEKQEEANAQTLVELAAQEVHEQKVDRCYRIESDWEKIDRRIKLPKVPRSAVLWTRGDLFYVETTAGDRRWAWGRDSDGNVWLAPNPHFGLIYTPEEITEPVAVACDVMSMNVETMLKDLLTSFHLRREAFDGDPSLVRIVAKAKRMQQKFREVTLELDPKTKTIHKVVIRRLVASEPTTVTYSLIDTANIPEKKYHLEGHLSGKFRKMGPPDKIDRERRLKALMIR